MKDHCGPLATVDLKVWKLAYSKDKLNAAVPQNIFSAGHDQLIKISSLQQFSNAESFMKIRAG
jgi:hypothetical protein